MSSVNVCNIDIVFHFADSNTVLPPNVTSPPPSNIALSNDQNSRGLTTVPQIFKNVDAIL